MVDYDERDCNLHRISNSNTRAVSTFSLIYIVNDKNKQRRTSISKSYNIKEWFQKTTNSITSFVWRIEIKVHKRLLCL